jgi:putative ABC transport system ATP-binding protein
MDEIKTLGSYGKNLIGSMRLPSQNKVAGVPTLLSAYVPKDPLWSRPEGIHPTAAHRRVVMDVRAITKSLPLGRERIDILKGISFQILSGEFVSIVGPSGSGKSTLLGIIAGLDNPTTGEVFIDNVNIARMSEGRLATVRNKKIGMVFQAFNLIPTLTAQENVEIPLYVGKHKGSPSTRAKELLGLVGLSHRLHHRPNQLSGGEQQRVAIARALATDPPIVIADEPTGNLDARNGENILNLIVSLRAQTGKTFIIATHDPTVASCADYSIRIVDGLVATIPMTSRRFAQ